MLLSFSFANHRSFAEAQQLVLTRVYQPDEPSQPALPVVGLFGPNASGKSNAVGALAYLEQLVLLSVRINEPGGGIEVDPFRLDPRYADAPSTYVVDLELDGTRYTYGLSVDSTRVLEEWLYSYPLRHRRKIFERREGKYSYGDEAKSTSIAQVESLTAPNVLFLSTTARFNQDLVQPVYQWFLRNLISATPSRYRGLRGDIIARGLSRDRRRLRSMAELLRAADTGIEDIVVKTHDPGPPEDSEVDRLKQRYAQDPELAEARIRAMSEPRSRLVFAHRGIEGLTEFELGDESEGTVQLLQIADRALAVIESGGTLVIDEIDTSLHPLLTAKLIGLFQTPTTNPRHAQLIFTCHDPTLLGTLDGVKVLRRDQIWFVSKDHTSGSSSLYPLTDFKPREEESRERRYLAGSYGAIPDTAWDLFEDALRDREEEAVANAETA